MIRFGREDRHGCLPYPPTRYIISGNEKTSKQGEDCEYCSRQCVGHCYVGRSKSDNMYYGQREKVAQEVDCKEDPELACIILKA